MSEKKTEVLEVRISSTTKRSLKSKAAVENKSVSEVVRELIGDYLQETVTPLKMKPEGNNMILYSLKSITAAAVLAGGFVLFAISPVQAEDMELKFKVKLVDTECAIEEYIQNVSPREGKIQVSLGEEVELVSWNSEGRLVTYSLKVVSMTEDTFTTESFRYIDGVKTQGGRGTSQYDSAGASSFHPCPGGVFAGGIHIQHSGERV